MTHLLLDMLACPACDGNLSVSALAMTCDGCGSTYRSREATTQWDLRLTTPKTHAVKYHLGDNTRPASNLFDTMPFNPSSSARPIADADGSLTYGNRLTPELLSYFPDARVQGGWMLDLGCGLRNFEQICRDRTGLNYVGIDYSGDAPDLLADAHALPFKDNTFEFVLSIAVLEHLAFPDVAMEEIFRVLKPGGIFIGTVAFLEPFHMNSYYHMTHLGTARALDHAGFEVVALAPNREWTGTRAQAEMTLFPLVPRRFKRMMTAMVTPISRILWAVRHRIKRAVETSDHRRLLETTGGYRFVVKKPA